MGGISVPKIPPPTAIPETGPETEEWAMRRARGRRGYTSTIITGQLAPKPTGKATTLGGSR